MSEDGADIYKLIEFTNDRLSDLQKSYAVLNEHHHILELDFNIVKTRLDTCIQILKFFVSPGVALLILVDLLP